MLILKLPYPLHCTNIVVYILTSFVLSLFTNLIEFICLLDMVEYMLGAMT